MCGGLPLLCQRRTLSKEGCRHCWAMGSDSPVAPDSSGSGAGPAAGRCPGPFLWVHTPGPFLPPQDALGPSYSLFLLPQGPRGLPEGQCEHVSQGANSCLHFSGTVCFEQRGVCLGQAPEATAGSSPGPWRGASGKPAGRLQLRYGRAPIARGARRCRCLLRCTCVS